jgi:S1-C subfamily serine protease
LLQGDRLTILQADGITPLRTTNLPRTYVRIAERDGYYIGVSKDPVAVEHVDKKTLRVTKSVKFHAHEITDLVLHPKRPLAYVAYKATMEFPRYRFLLYDEAKGEGRQSDTYLGTFLAMDPGGSFLMAGYRDIYERGSRLIFNPGRIHAVPDYGSVDWLVRYDLDAQGLPRSGETHDKAGGNGRGIRLSPDGRRVSYLSVVGSPPFSRQLCAWDVRDFEKIPTIFPIQDQASTEHLAYHPFLPWVICLRESAEPLVFHTETGDPQPDKFEPLELAGARVHGLWVAADGKAAVLNTSVNGIHYLQRIPFKLSRDQQRVCESGYKALAAAASAATASPAPSSAPAAKIPLAELQSLQGGPGKAMTARDVAKWFTDAVVVVKTPDGNGTGMIVGSDGYILTCHHCIADATRIQVSYRRPVNGEVRSVTIDAKLLAEDEARDLALLKIRVPFPLRTVRFGPSAALESGERVYVIGNPGVSTTILDYTITEGIVSSSSRKLGNDTYIQTSAQVNPGSSGGPLFNGNGLVVGQVVLKATIEGAGFATPSDQLVGFLVRNTDLSAGLKLWREWMDSSGTRRIAATLEGISDDAITVHGAMAPSSWCHWTGSASPISRSSNCCDEVCRLRTGNTRSVGFGWTVRNGVGSRFRATMISVHMFSGNDYPHGR